MNNKEEHIDKNDYLDPRAEALIKEIGPSFSKSKEDSWEELQRRIQEEETSSRQPVWWLLAASVTVLLALGLTARFYGKTISSQHMALRNIELPDGSRVALDTESELKYYPLWWTFERKLELKGRGYFEVEKGNRFEVKSDNGTTRVLGTSFTIDTKSEDYNVRCLTGKVQVNSLQQEVILNPDQMTHWTQDGVLVRTDGIPSLAQNDWLQPELSFESAPVIDVISELKMRYQIDINSDEMNSERRLTSTFRLPIHAETALEIVCSATGHEYSLTPKGTYEIREMR